MNIEATGSSTEVYLLQTALVLDLGYMKLSILLNLSLRGKTFEMPQNVLLNDLAKD